MTITSNIEQFEKKCITSHVSDFCEYLTRISTKESDQDQDDIFISRTVQEHI